MNQPDLDNLRKHVREYQDLGWVPISLSAGSKAPDKKHWQKTKSSDVRVDKDFVEGKNVGVLLGVSSGNLVDIDEDCPEAVALADSFLPPSPSKFGRASKPDSHRLYYAKDVEYKKYIDPTDTAGKKVLVEIRSHNCQTMFPPSIHPSGEAVVWSGDGRKPDPIESEVLEKAVRKLAFASILLRHWTDGKRHDLTLSLAGSLLPHGWKPQEIQDLLAVIQQAAGDREKRSPDIESTLKKLEAGEAVTGLPTLSELLGANPVGLRELISGQTWDNTEVFKEKDANIVARAFALEQEGVRHWRGDFFTWDKTSWSQFSDEDLFSKLGLWLETKKVLNRRGIPVPFSPSIHDTKEVAGALARVFHLWDTQEAPFWIQPKDDDPSPSELLPFKNGILNLRTFELRPPDPRLFSVHRVACDYLPAATAPTWERFQKEIFPQPDDTRISHIEEVLGYLLSGSTSLQKAFLWVGKRRSGKGTLGRIIKELVGPARYVGPTISEFSSPFGMANLVGKSVAFLADARGQTRHDPYVIVERILTITGEDSLSVNRKFKPYWDGQLPTRIILASNVTPKLTDPSGVIVSRFLAVEFTESFIDREDPALTDKLKLELPGIVNKCLDGFKRLIKRGKFIQPEIGKDLLERLEENTGPVRVFVNEECEVDPEYEVKTQELFTAFTDWSRDRGYQQMAVNTFGSDLTALGLGIKKCKPRDESEEAKPDARVYVYKGIRRKPFVVQAPTPKIQEGWEKDK